MVKYKKLLLSAAAGAVLVSAGIASAQATGAGSYVMANGNRTNDYAAAVQSWRDDPMFAVDYSKAYLGLEHAYARGLTGAGVTLGLVDSGVHFDHPLFATPGKVRGIDLNTTPLFANNGAVNPRLFWESHGTHVAGTMAGNRFEGGTMFGNAFGANLISASANFVQGDFWGRYGLRNNLGAGTAEIALDALILEGSARIINNSWGTGSPQGPSNEVIEALIRNDQLIVISAGNSPGRPNVGIGQRPLTYDNADISGNYLVVTNYRQDDTPSPTTSTCGASLLWCVSGPGHLIVSGVRGLDGDTSLRAVRNLDTAAFNRMIRGATLADHVFENAAAIFKEEFNALLRRRQEAAANGTPWNDITERQALARRGAVLSLIASSAMNRFNPDGAGLQIGTTAIENRFVQALGQDYILNLLSDLDRIRLELVAEYFTDLGYTYEEYTGTSMAAPNIAGFAALLVEAFPEYNTALITDIITSTSRDIGAPGVDGITGWGVPEMQAALNGPSALRGVREVDVAFGTVDVWSNDIVNARERYSDGARLVMTLLNQNHIGGLTKVGGGELVLTGSVNYTGPTRAIAGLLTVDGSINNSQVSVADTGIIGGIGRIANITAEAGGVVAPGNSANPFGTLTVAGDATFLPDSYLWVRSAVNGTNYSKLDIGGNANLEGGNVIVKADQGTWNLRVKNMRILTATGGVNGTFQGVTSDLAFLTPTLTYESNAVILDLQRNDVSIAAAGKNRNERSVGGALNTLTRNTTGGLQLEDAILDGSLDAVKAALPSLTGEVHSSVAGVAVGDSRFIRNAILERGRGASHLVQAIDHSGVYAWASGTFGEGSFEGNKEYAKFDTRSGGFAAGIDVGNERGLIGLAFGETNTRLERHALANNASVKSRQLGLYGATTVRGFNLRAGGALTKTDASASRSVSLNAFSDRLNSDYEGDGWQAFGEASWLTTVRGSSVEPYVNYAYVSYEADVKEKGGEAALSGKVSDKAQLLTVGLRTNTKLAGGEAGRPRLTLVGHLAWTEDFNEANPLFRARFADSPAYSVRGQSLAGEGLTTGIGINIQASERAAIDFGYSGSHSSDYTDNRLSARLSVKF